MPLPQGDTPLPQGAHEAALVALHTSVRPMLPSKIVALAAGAALAAYLIARRRRRSKSLLILDGGCGLELKKRKAPLPFVTLPTASSRSIAIISRMVAP